MTTCESHQIAEGMGHTLLHAMPALVDTTVRVDPCECDRCGDPHIARHHVQGTVDSRQLTVFRDEEWY